MICTTTRYTKAKSQNLLAATIHTMIHIIMMILTEDLENILAIQATVTRKIREIVAETAVDASFGSIIWVG